MINLKALTVGLGFILVVLIFLIHKIRERSLHKKKIIEMKNRRKRRGKKKDRKKN